MAGQESRDAVCSAILRAIDSADVGEPLVSVVATGVRKSLAVFRVLGGDRLRLW